MARKRKIDVNNWQESAEYAGFYVRLVAMVIDSFAVMIPLSLFFGLLYATLWGGENFGEQQAMLLSSAQGNPELVQDIMLQFAEEGRFSRWALENVIFIVSSGALFIGMWYYFSATPGKLLMGIKLVDAETGMPPSTRQNIVRYLGYFVSSLPFLLGFLFVAWDKRKQGWHDKMAGTVVVYKRSLPPVLAEMTLSKEKAQDTEAI